jgi:hypothetical protein
LPSRSVQTVVKYSSRTVSFLFPVLCNSSATPSYPNTTFMIPSVTPRSTIACARFTISATPCATPDTRLDPGSVQTTSSCMIFRNAFSSCDLRASMNDVASAFRASSLSGFHVLRGDRPSLSNIRDPAGEHSIRSRRYVKRFPKQDDLAVGRRAVTEKSLVHVFS